MESAPTSDGELLLLQPIYPARPPTGDYDSKVVGAYIDHLLHVIGQLNQRIEDYRYVYTAESNSVPAK